MTVEDLTLNITQQIDVKASIEDTFAALLEQMGPGNERGDGSPMPMRIEPWPGGRWYRDLGGDDGHFWGQVQAIKRPALLEISGPLFASYPMVSNIQYRLIETKDGTRIEFRHTALGFIQDDHRQNVNRGWAELLERTRLRAEAKAYVSGVH